MSEWEGPESSGWITGEHTLQDLASFCVHLLGPEWHSSHPVGHVMLPVGGLVGWICGCESYVTIP